MGMFNNDGKITTNRLSAYERRRKLEIDEELSEYRRQEKNRAVEDVKSYQDTRVELAKKRAADETKYSEEKLKRETELARLDGEITARKAVEETQKIHRKLTEDARKEKHDEIVAGKDAVIAEKDKHIAHLTKTLESLLSTGGETLKSTTKALGEAAAKDHSTKVIGVGHNVEKEAKK